jgi:hypothetical protein
MGGATELEARAPGDDITHTVSFEGTVDRLVAVVAVPAPAFAQLTPRLREACTHVRLG